MTEQNFDTGDLQLELEVHIEFIESLNEKVLSERITIDEHERKLKEEKLSKAQKQKVLEMIEVSKKVIRDSRVEIRAKKKDVQKIENQIQKNKIMSSDSSDEERETSDNNTTNLRK